MAYRPAATGQEELERAGAARVYEDPADLLRHLDEIGSRRDGELKMDWTKPLPRA